MSESSVQFLELVFLIGLWCWPAFVMFFRWSLNWPRTR